MTNSDWIRGALSWLATYGLHSTLFLGGAFLWCTLRAPRANRNRERLWKLALVGGVLSTTLQLALGARPLLGRIDWQAAAPAAAHEVAPPTPERAEAPLHTSSPAPVLAEEVSARQPASHVPHADARRAAGESSAAEPLPQAEVEPRSASPVVAARRASPATPRSALAAARPTGWMLGAWVALGALGLLGLLASWTGLRLRMLGRRELRSGPLVETLARLRRRAGLTRGVQLTVSTRTRAPFSTGLWRAEICLPEAAVHALTPAQQEALLAHELAHLVRRDPAWFGLGYLIEKLFFFQPLNRLARRQLAELAEVACDDWAVRWTGARLALASCLTEVAGWIVSEKPRLVTPPGLAGARSRLGQRIERLLDDRRSPHGEPPAPWWPALAAGSLALTALAVPGVAATPARPAAPPPPTRPVSTPSSASAPPAAAPTAAVPLAAALEAEMAELAAQVTALHEELRTRALDERFAAALARIDERLAQLLAQKERARELLARLAPLTPASPPDPAPASTSNR